MTYYQPLLFTDNNRCIIVVCNAIVSDHTWFFAKLDLVSVLVLDYFGGVKVVTKEQYFNAKPY